MANKLALGLMSGTSADGLTICAVRLRPFQIVCFKNYPYPGALQKELLNAYDLKAPALSTLHFKLGSLYAKTVKIFLKEHGLSPQGIFVIGSHGQTIYHGPKDKTPNTLQIGEPAFMAEETGVPVVSDFRARDIALGGEGAPLIPFFDEYIWGQKTQKILLNIGGISNFSVVGKNLQTVGFDVGPGNTLMDLASQQFFHKPYDKNGAWAAKGSPDKLLVSHLLKQAYFKRKPPKSLDKNIFGKNYLDRYFSDIKNPTDLLATLTWFTAAAIAKAVHDFVPKSAQKEIVISGGGIYNETLLNYLQELNSSLKISTTFDYGINPQAKEAAAFAVMAAEALAARTNHCAHATGAKHNAILGKITL